MSTRSEKDRLKDVVEHCDLIAGIVSRFEKESFFNDQLAPTATLHYLMIVGEAMNHVGAPLKKRYPAVAWREATWVRNRIVHGYFDLEWGILWDTCATAVPRLKIQIEAILAAEFPDE